MLTLVSAQMSLNRHRGIKSVISIFTCINFHVHYIFPQAIESMSCGWNTVFCYINTFYFAIVFQTACVM